VQSSCLNAQQLSTNRRLSEASDRRRSAAIGEFRQVDIGRLRNCPEISSLFERKPKAPAFQTLARIQNTIACGFGSNKAMEIGKLFRD